MRSSGASTGFGGSSCCANAASCWMSGCSAPLSRTLWLAAESSGEAEEDAARHVGVVPRVVDLLARLGHGADADACLLELRGVPS